MLFTFFVCLCLILTKVFGQQIHITGNKETFEHNYYRTHVFNPKENFYLLQIIQRELEKEENEELIRQREREKQMEKENEIYRKYLVNRIKHSSILRDFHTMRY